MTSVNLENETLEHTKQPLMGHLLDLRRRLIWVFSTMFLSTLICYFFVSDIYNFLVTPLAEAMGPGDTNRLIYTNLTEAFFTYLKVALFSGIFITFPILLIQVWIFIAPGLYEKERKAFLPFLAATPVLFFLGAACVYYLVLPMAWPFFLSFQMTSPIRQCCHYRLWQTAGLLTFSQVALDLRTFSQVALEFSRCGFLSMSVVWQDVGAGGGKRIAGGTA